jgi:hypothetical protein
MRRQRALGPTDSRMSARRRAHGLTPAEVDALRVRQGGACAICRRTGLRLVIDHDHTHCGGTEGCRRCVRGLLCARCNGALGWLGDSNASRVVLYLGGQP